MLILIKLKNQLIKRNGSVVNALLHKGFSHPYLSRYNSVSLSHQWLNPDTILSAIDVSTDTSLAINVNQDTST